MYFSLAQRESQLGDRGDRVIELRYGIVSEDPHTREQVSREMGLTEERVRQLYRKALLIIHCRGRRQISRGETGGAPARLLLYIEESIHPEEPGWLQRTLEFAERELAFLPRRTHALPLLVYLLYGQGVRVSQTLTQLSGSGRQRDSVCRLGHSSTGGAPAEEALQGRLC